MIHMLVRDGRRSPDACWPVREMWQRLVCRDKLESVACSSQSLQGLAETPTGSCLPSLSFISFFFTLSIFHVSSISRSLPYFVALPSPSFLFVFLLSCQACQHLSAVNRFNALVHVDVLKQFILVSVSLLHIVCVNIQPNPVPGWGSACSTSTHMHTYAQTHIIKHTWHPHAQTHKQIPFLAIWAFNTAAK